MSNINNQIDVNMSNDLLASSLPARSGLYRSLSAKRSRDPSHRKSVSFNDVPTVHEVPLYDSVRNSNYDPYRSWIYAEPASSTSINSPFSSSPLHITSATNHKPYTTLTRSNSTLYSSTSRLADWSMRTKTLKITEDSLDHNSSCNPPLIVVHTPEERSRMNTNTEFNLLVTPETVEERKRSYRPATPHHPHQSEHVRSLPFTYVPMSESSITYTSLLSSANSSSNEHMPAGNTRSGRVRSATLPFTTNQHSTRHNENSVTVATRPTTSSSRTVLKPATIAFQCAQPSINFSVTKPPTVPVRSTSSAAHARLLYSLNRPLSSAYRYNTTHPVPDSLSKPSPTNSLTRSRSANLISTRRHANSPIPTLDGQSEGTNNYLSSKRTPNIRHTYGSDYTHRLLLPADIN
ncbi:unnamed protein product [Adineta ricciae]|uniref:Uncharacterized protein n=1 Tax=Adineta ricciae TaxID=249248 RepID=A0A814SQH6_ADIRI|nr:unnamed protein product [Adineta ricciae]CAF1394134.1 unnamed protein product [Adineta ricciae]